MQAAGRVTPIARVQVTTIKLTAAPRLIPENRAPSPAARHLLKGAKVCAVDFLQLPGNELLNLSDDDLGEWLITAWIGSHAQQAGFVPGAVTPDDAMRFTELAKRLIEETAKVDSESVANAPLESVFRKAFKGDFAAAGRMYRTLLLNRTDAAVKAKFAARDLSRQQGTRKPRRPEVDKWIDQQLQRNPDARAPALWASAPDWITDQLGKDRFAKRVTSARKRRRVASK